MKIIYTNNFQPETALETYLQWVINEVPIRPWWMPKDELYFTDKLTGIVLHRQEQFQTQLFLAQPGLVIPSHTHPNVDSFEVALYGMTFTHSGVTIPKELIESGDAIYVDHDDEHGGFPSDNGGAFLSVQQWLNDTPPSSVGNDWKGETTGPLHQSQIK